MKPKVHKSEIIAGANHQININFITKLGDTHLVMLIPINLFNDTNALERFDDVVKSSMKEEDGQYYFELISNLTEPGIILETTKLISFETYAEITNSIMNKSHNYVKEVFLW
jgi:hypothetical protein